VEKINEAPESRCENCGAALIKIGWTRMAKFMIWAAMILTTKVKTCQICNDEDMHASEK